MPNWNPEKKTPGDKYQLIESSLFDLFYFYLCAELDSLLLIVLKWNDELSEWNTIEHQNWTTKMRVLTILMEALCLPP